MEIKETTRDNEYHPVAEVVAPEHAEALQLLVKCYEYFVRNGIYCTPRVEIKNFIGLDEYTDEGDE